MRREQAEILLASYNGAQYIREQIDSIVQQTDANWHLTASDDGSTDETPQILRAYAEKDPDRIACVCGGHRFGCARDHFFHLIKTCGAAYMLTCDQDDRWHPDKLQRTMDALIQAEEKYGRETPILVFSDQTPTDAQLRPIAPSLMRYQNQYAGAFDYRSLLMQNVVTGGAMGFNRALAQLACRCEAPQETIMHDWWMAAAAARFGRIIYIDEPLGDYRQHGANSVGAKDVRSFAHVANRLLHPGEIRRTILAKKRQAQVFLDTYGELLTGEDRRFLTQMVRPRSGMLFYWRHRSLIHGFFRLAGMMALG